MFRVEPFEPFEGDSLCVSGVRRSPTQVLTQVACDQRRPLR